MNIYCTFNLRTVFDTSAIVLHMPPNSQVISVRHCGENNLISRPSINGVTTKYYVQLSLYQADGHKRSTMDKSLSNFVRNTPNKINVAKS